MKITKCSRAASKMMRNFLVLVCLSSSAILAEESQIERYQGCWQTESPDGSGLNTITFCIEGDTLTVSVFYPNDGHNSTFCTSTGVAAVVEGRAITVATEQGLCENGRSLGAVHMKCTLLGLEELNCIGAEYRQIRLWRVDRSETPPTDDE
ncbi:MAG: hypothetical protein AAGC71_14165 [Pseudomonadota bacterium]